MTEYDKNGVFTLRWFIWCTVIYTFLGGALITLSELSRYLFAFLPLICYTGSLIFVVLLALVGRGKKEVMDIKSSGGEAGLALLFMQVVMSTIIFGLICRELYINSGAGFIGGSNLDRLPWIEFGFDNLFEAILFDIPTIYGLHLSSIKAYTFLTQTLVLIFRLTIDLIPIKALIGYWRTMKTEKVV